MDSPLRIGGCFESLLRGRHRWIDRHRRRRKALRVGSHLSRCQLIHEREHIAHDLYLGTHRQEHGGNGSDIAPLPRDGVAEVQLPS